MPTAAANVSTARKKDMKDKVEKKDKKIEVSLTNWFLGGSLISGTSSTSSTRSGVRRMIAVKSDNDSILSKDDKKGDKVKPAQHEKCEACGKRKPVPDGEKDAKAKSGDKKSEEKKGEKKSDDKKSEDKKSEPKKDDKNSGENSESKKDDKKDEAKKSNTAESKQDGEKAWTSEQDTKIKEMKAENKSWKDIALEVGASKKDVQNRHKELLKSSDGAGEKKDAEKKDETSAWETDSNGWKTIVDDGGDALNANMPDFGTLFDDFGDDREQETVKETGGETTDWGATNDAGKSWETSATGGGDGAKKQEETTAWDSGNETDKNEWGSTSNSGGGKTNSGSGGAGKKKKGGKKDKQQNGGGGSQKKNQDSSGGGGSGCDGNGGCNGSCGNGNGNGDGFNNPFDDSNNFEEEEAPSERGRLIPDRVWTQDDCEILEWLAHQYENNKWLHLQADFYNWTGRMVIAEIIEQKFKDDGAAF
ncbi:hypothetical protein V8E51_011540 [Hyaloscypha variabilis]